ncbi:MAG TPA: hypothetical protein VGY56_08355 [Verrucomicrobiae bacterium]|nr:hypothetical protein [Verrucomicrobiae bacterium]
MSFEQPASLNRYIYPPLSFTWAFRWKMFKALLPVFVFTAVLLYQAVLLRQWAADHWEIWPFLAIPGLLLLMVFAVEIQMRLPLKYRRILNLKEKYVQTGSGMAQRVRWENIIRWQFSDVPADNNYRVTAMEYKWGQKTRRHSIVLNKSENEQLISELKFRRQKSGLAFSISEQKLALPSETFRQIPSTNNHAGLYLYLAGSLFFIEGLPLHQSGSGTAGVQRLPFRSRKRFSASCRRAKVGSDTSGTPRKWAPHPENAPVRF